jgi:hypothetical protein
MNCELMLTYDTPALRQTGSRNMTGQKTLPTIWGTYMKLTILWVAFLDPSDSYFLFADFVGFYAHWTYMHIFRRIFLSNYWLQKSDIWSQASNRYTILWVAFLDPSDSYFLFANLVGFYAHFSSHFSQQLLMAEIWYFVTSNILDGRKDRGKTVYPPPPSGV